MSDSPYERLRDSIYEGELQPGQKIVERSLAEQLGVSRIPLRESLVRLETEGLIRSVPYSATYVEEFSPADIREIFSMRLLHEPYATRLATQDAGEGLVEELENLRDQMIRDTEHGDMAALDRTDYAYHYAIVKACGHKRLRRAYEGAHIRIMGPRTHYAHLMAAPFDNTARDHQEIIDRIRARDADGAEKAAREHIEGSAVVTIEKLLGLRL